MASAKEIKSLVIEVDVKDPLKASVASPIKARLEQQAQSPRKFSPKELEEKNRAAELRRAKLIQQQKQKAHTDGQLVNVFVLF